MHLNYFRCIRRGHLPRFVKKGKIMTEYFYTGTTAVCPVGMLLRSTDVDDCRAIQMIDGRIYNLLNGFSHAVPRQCLRVLEEPEGIRKLLAALISSQEISDDTFALITFSKQHDGRDPFVLGSELALSDMDASAIGVTRIKLESKRSSIESRRASLSIRYFDDEIDAVLESAFDNPEGTLLLDRSSIELPAAVKLGVNKLLEHGFRIACVIDASQSTIMLRRGDRNQHVHVQLSWLSA
jgi:hypothetical protein